MLFLLVVSFPVTLVGSVCLPDTGPAGAYDCYAGSFYDNQPQWATCVTSAYLKQKSKGKLKGNNNKNFKGSKGSNFLKTCFVQEIEQIETES